MDADVDPRPSSLSICSGIGGLDLATAVVFGARGVCYLEREAACVELLASRMEEGWLDSAPVHTDARTFDGRPWRGRVDLVTAGYPCQPFSLAGKGLAEADPRHLWPDIKRIVGEVQPAVVVLENVQGHLKRGFSTVLGDLDELGFDAEWGVYSAAQAGSPHRRNRLFVLAYTKRELLWQQSRRKRRENWADSLQPSVVGKAVAWPPGPKENWTQIPEHLWPAVEPALCGMADGFPSRVDRMRALGNAVVPQQAVVALRDLVGRLV